MQNDSDLAEVVKREKEAHEIDDVLAKSKRLKNKFRFYYDNPSLRRMEEFLKQKMLHNVNLVLDYGCGEGEHSLKLASSNKKVVGIDISSTYVEKARLNCQHMDNCEFLVADGHNLPFESNTFDLVIGRGILHHLDCEIALQEIMRVLKPGGQLVFQEPLGSNPLMRIFRLFTPNARTVDEKPFFRRDLKKLFDKSLDQSEYFGLLTTPLMIFFSIIRFRSKLVTSIIDSLEQSLNKNIPFVRAWNQYIVMIQNKEQ